MKITHLSHTDGASGAGRAAYRIHCSLLKLGVESTLLVSSRRTDDPTVISVNKGKIKCFRARLCEYLEARAGRKNVQNISTFFSPSHFGHFNVATHIITVILFVGLCTINRIKVNFTPID